MVVLQLLGLVHVEGDLVRARVDGGEGVVGDGAGVLGLVHGVLQVLGHLLEVVQAPDVLKVIENKFVMETLRCQDISYAKKFLAEGKRNIYFLSLVHKVYMNDMMYNYVPLILRLKSNSTLKDSGTTV